MFSINVLYFIAETLACIAKASELFSADVYEGGS